MTAGASTRGNSLSGEPPMEPADIPERILITAYELFSRRSIHDVGVNELIECSAVSKSTFYRHFPSKDDLVRAVLARRDQVWFGEVVAEARRRGASPEDELLAIFEVFADWLGSGGYKSNIFIKVLMEMGPDHPLGQASVQYLARIRGHAQELADDAGLERSGVFARSWHLLLKGSIIATMEGDQEAVGLAQQMARHLIERHRRCVL